MELSLQQMKIIDGFYQYRHKIKSRDRSDEFTARQTNKLRKDRQMVIEICRCSLVEIVASGEWQTLQDAIKRLSKKSTSYGQLRVQHKDLINSREDMANTLVIQIQQHEQDLCAAEENITILRDLLEDTVMNSKARLLYAEKWLTARNEDLQLHEPVANPHLPRLGHERRVHKELEKAYEVQVKKLEADIDKWRVRYGDDTAEINERLSQKSEQLEATTARRIELQTLYNLHEGEMRGWLTFKRERAARRAREEKARKSATTIQAWWRGVMVRHALGSFRYLKNMKKPPVKTKKK